MARLSNLVVPTLLAGLTFIITADVLTSLIHEQGLGASVPFLIFFIDSVKEFLLNGGLPASTGILVILASGLFFFIIHLVNQSDTFSIHRYFFVVLSLVVVFSCLPPDILSLVPQEYGGTSTATALIVFVICARLFPDTGREPVHGAVFVTGAGNGMGRATAIYLSSIGYKVFAADICFKSLDDDKKKLEEECLKKHGNVGDISAISLDVCTDASVANAVETVKKGGVPLYGVINCAGLGYTGPAEYFPMDMYKRCLEVNFFGYIRVAQAFLPLVKESCSNPSSRRGRFIFVGTGGGSLTNTPGMLSAYMSSKWAGEAFCSVLRSEMRLTKQRIDTAMVNPGFIKPTTLAAGGLKLIEEMWKKMKPMHGDAPKKTYSGLIDKFHAFTEQMPGTDPIHIAYAMEEIMGASEPKVGYRVGWDSKLSPFVGMLPFCGGEHMAEGNMFPPK
eukprot:UC4_evm1s1053